MGQKVHPKGFRLGVIRDWDSRWYADKKDFGELVHQDYQIRRHIKREMFSAGISRIEVERFAGQIKITVHAARPGMVIGRGGTLVEGLRKDLEEMSGNRINIRIVEVPKPDINAQLVAEGVADQLVRRVSFRRAMRQSLQRAMREGAKGCKIMVSGRLGGVEMARREWMAEGSVPLHTLRADIDYGFAEANTTYGTIGVKVWIYTGDVMPTKGRQSSGEEAAAHADAKTG
ncbi:MAG: 30S ribosomal protein S3 [Clostridia bacterium]